jgi:hypothetical protein
MGIFHDMATVINLSPVTLTVTFDGQATDIPPGEHSIPRVTVAYAKNQNPVPGSQDMENPTISGARYLISEKGKRGERQEPFTREEWEAMGLQPSRFNMDEYFADQLGPKEHVVARGRGRKTQAKSSFDAGVRVTTPETIGESN